VPGKIAAFDRFPVTSRRAAGWDRPAGARHQGRPASITTDQVEDVVVATLESMPKNATHWSRGKMAERSGMSKSTIGRIRKTFELKPHCADGFKLSSNPFFKEKVYDVVRLYLNPPNPLWCSAWTKNRRSRRWPVPSWPSR